MFKSSAVAEMGNRLVTIVMGRKLGAAVPPLEGVGSGGAELPSNTIRPWPMPTSVPGVILILPAVWPEQTCAENWGLYPFWESGSLSPLGRDLPPYQVAS